MGGIVRMRARIFFSMFLLILLIGDIASASYEWRGELQLGDKVNINGFLFTVDRDKATNRTAIIIYGDGGTLRLYYVDDKVSFNISGLQVRALLWKEKVILTVSSEEFLLVNANATMLASSDELIKLKDENRRLKETIANQSKKIKELEAQIAKLRNEQKEQSKTQPQNQPKPTNNELIKLKDENRRLKETIANQTQLIMQLRAEIKTLQMQNNYLVNITKDAYLYANKVGLEETYQKEKKRARIINFLWGLGKLGAVLLSMLAVTLGYLYYNWRKV